MLGSNLLGEGRILDMWGQILERTAKKCRYWYRCVVHPNVIKVHGVFVPAKGPGITEGIRYSLYKESYESAECELIQEALRKGDVYLEIGCGLGLVSALACQQTDESNVFCYEPVPDTVQLAKTTFQKNGISPNLVEVALVADDREDVMLYIGAAFWSSSLWDRKSGQTINVPARRLHTEIMRIQPDVVLMDGEGAEAVLVQEIAGWPPRDLILEMHPHVIGVKETARLWEVLKELNFERIRQVGKVEWWRLNEGADAPE